MFEKARAKHAAPAAAQAAAAPVPATKAAGALEEEGPPSPFWSDHKGSLRRVSVRPVLGGATKAGTEAAEAAAVVATEASASASASDDVKATPAADGMEETAVGKTAEAAPAPAPTPAEGNAAEEKVPKVQAATFSSMVSHQIPCFVEAGKEEEVDEEPAEEKAVAAAAPKKEGGFFTMLASLWPKKVKQANTKKEGNAGGSGEATAAVVAVVSMEIGVDGVVALVVAAAAPVEAAATVTETAAETAAAVKDTKEKAATEAAAAVVEAGLAEITVVGEETTGAAEDPQKVQAAAFSTMVSHQVPCFVDEVGLGGETGGAVDEFKPNFVDAAVSWVSSFFSRRCAAQLPSPTPDPITCSRFALTSPPLPFAPPSSRRSSLTHPDPPPRLALKRLLATHHG